MKSKRESNGFWSGRGQGIQWFPLEIAGARVSMRDRTMEEGGEHGSTIEVEPM